MKCNTKEECYTKEEYEDAKSKGLDLNYHGDYNEYFQLDD